MKSRVSRIGLGLIVGACLASMSFAAYAEHPKEQDPAPTVPPSAVSDSRAQAGALAAAGAVAGVHNETSAELVGGDSSARARSGDSNSEANGSNTSVIDASTVYERQVGTLIMGTVIPVDCGFGGQAGGANTNGSGFLGASWTTDRCYTLKVANAMAAVGEYDVACELWSDVASKALKRRRVTVDCATVGARLRAAHSTPAPVVHVVSDVSNAAPVGSSQYVTKEELQRAFKQAQSK